MSTVLDEVKKLGDLAGQVQGLLGAFQIPVGGKLTADITVNLRLELPVPLVPPIEGALHLTVTLQPGTQPVLKLPDGMMARFGHAGSGT